MNYDVLIIGAGPGGIFSAYELSKLAPQLKIAVFESGNALNKRKCPIDGKKIKSCIECKILLALRRLGFQILSRPLDDRGLHRRRLLHLRI